MKPLLKLSSFVALAGSLLVPAKADIVMEVSSARSYLQTGPLDVAFEGGDLFMELRDGVIIIAPCADHPSPILVPPYMGCPLGTTGFIAFGDFSGDDGIRDNLSFWSVSDVIPAFLVEPFRPEAVGLVEAPPTALPRPLADARDTSVLLFYNVLTPDVRQFDVTLYNMARNYPAGPAGRFQHIEEIKTGVYTFEFPRLDRNNRLPIRVTLSDIPNAIGHEPRYPRMGFRFTSGVYDEEGNYLMDPRVINALQWTGNDGSNSRVGADRFRLSVLAEDALIDEETGETFDEIVFPPSGTAPLLIDNPLTQEYLFPPFFFEVGDEFLFELEFERVLATSAISFDASSRLFHLNLRFVDSYEGFAALEFPSGNTVGASGPNADFDNDAFSNLLEFALQSDPLDPDSVPTLPTLDSNIDGTIFAEVVKRPNAAVIYSFAVSENDGKFVKITEDHPDWEITTDDDERLVVTSRLPADPATYKVRLDVKNLKLR